MHALMRDSAHDRHHVYRVLYAALDIARHEANVDMDVLLAACLLHDIGREKQFEDPLLCHAKVGGEMAYRYLLSAGWDEQKALHVRACVASHRFRGESAPESLEAKILFDADKLDACGALGIARTLVYEGQVGEPLYVLDENGGIATDGGGADISSFFQEYHFKLKTLYGAFYTARATEIASERRQSAVRFYNALHGEITQNAEAGREAMEALWAGEA